MDSIGSGQILLHQLMELGGMVHPQLMAQLMDNGILQIFSGFGRQIQVQRYLLGPCAPASQRLVIALMTSRCFFVPYFLEKCADHWS